MENKRVFNFSAGPSTMPMEVLETAAKEMTNFEGSGMGVMEMSHRSKVYLGIYHATEAKFREVFKVPDNYRIIFMQGGATLQFSAIPLNLMTKNGKADYLLTGSFSTNAQKEAVKYGEINIAFTGKDEGFVRIPGQEDLKLDPKADYVHYCDNNTIYGTKFNYVPDTGDVPLVCDMSSCILSEEVDVSKFGMIYAGAQKNMGPAGLAVVIIRDDLLLDPQEKTPVMLNFKTLAEKESMYNTPNTWGIYVLGLMMDWVKSEGGVPAMNEKAKKRAQLVYDAIEASNGYYNNPNEKDSRSIMNVVFRLPNEELEAKFAKESVEAGMTNLKGHRSVGGIRASMYNALPIEAAEYLVDFMKKFQENNPV